ncbi:uncharacterized protein LOC142589818 isoform X2 [Dermacentor variabilis]|uniref:uncharacterized protein LOC142589818 isoform X2 n=1 Tax=Dermacentor variabilis TaxID=34621 RepID=UPI003F5C8B97
MGRCVLVCALYQWQRLSRMRAHRTRGLVVRSQLSAREPYQGQPEDYAEDTDTASTLTSGTGVLEDDDQLDLAAHSESSFGIYCWRPVCQDMAPSWRHITGAFWAFSATRHELEAKYTNDNNVAAQPCMSIRACRLVTCGAAMSSSAIVAFFRTFLLPPEG